MFDDKYLLLAGFSNKFEKIMDTNEYEIYHVCCEDEGNNDLHYGIYANGILAESTDEITLSRIENFNLINLEYKTENNTILLQK